MLRTSARRPARMAPTAIAVAMCDVPTPGGPMSSTPSWVWTNRALANSTILVFGIFGLKLPVEVGERLHDGDARLFETAREETVGAPGELVFHEQFEKFQMGERGGFGLRDAPREGVDHAGQPQVPQTGRELRIHRKKSSKGYWVIGRIAGSSVASAGVGRTGVRSTSWRMV